MYNQHPSFGVVTLTKSKGTSIPLFQSDIEHDQVINLSVHTASRKRDLKHDWVHPEKEIVEIQMSTTQWGALVSSMGVGSGVPVTISKVQGNRVDPPPYEPRIAANVKEVQGAFEDVLSSISASLKGLTEAIEQKQGIKATREALHRLQVAVTNAPSNASFAVSSLAEAAESLVTQAFADIEANAVQAGLENSYLK